MNKTTFVTVSPARPNPSGIGSQCVRIERTEWTPEPASRVPIRSTWKSAVGKPLTNHRIEYYQRAGVYGDEARRAALERQENRDLKRKRVETKRKLLSKLLARYV